MLNTKSFLTVDFGAGSLKLAEFETNEVGGLSLKSFVIKPLGLEGSADATREDRLPIEIAGLQPSGRFVRAIVEDHWTAHALAPIAVDSGDVRAGHPIVLEALVERLDAHRPDAFGNQIADRIVDHRRGDAGLQLKAIR